MGRDSSDYAPADIRALTVTSIVFSTGLLYATFSGQNIIVPKGLITDLMVLPGAMTIDDLLNGAFFMLVFGLVYAILYAANNVGD